MTQPAEAYPLYWPVGHPRTPNDRRRRSRYEVSDARARDDLLAELRRWGARHIIVSTNVALRRDGLPYANQRVPEDPGVAVYWTARDRTPMVMAFDGHPRVGENMRAIGKSIEALRALDRIGAKSIADRAFAGFKQLGEGASHWRTVLGFSPDERVTGEQLRSRYRSLAVELHPDAGGDAEAFKALVSALEQAKEELR